MTPASRRPWRSSAGSLRSAPTCGLPTRSSTRHDVPPGLELVALDESQLAAADLVLVLTDHDAFDWKAVEHVADKVLDTRNRLAGTGAEIL